jgi:predicted ATPase/DNA-binding SARP family transcriptional activator
VEFRVLGWLEVRRERASVDLPGARARRLLVALLVHAGRVVTVDRLADVLWSDDQPGDPRNAVQTAVARLRDRLGDPNPIVTRSPGYLIDVGADELDALRFDALVDEAARYRQDPATARRLLVDALGLWRGPAYAEFADDVARVEALRLEERRISATAQLAEARLLLGETDAVIADLEAETARQPLRERLVELWMEALATADRPADALAVHRAYRQRLAEETGLEPSPSVQELEGRILRGELAGTGGPTSRLQRPGSGRPSGELALPAVSTSLIGRGAEQERAQRALADARVVTITGVGGVGKTRLAAEIMRSVHQEHQREVAWVELAAVDDPGAVAHVTADATGVDLDGLHAPEAELIDALTGRDLLLVMDNAEHLLDPVADLVADLTKRCPAIDVLVTSRERLAVPAEQVLPLAPLVTTAAPGQVSPAVELFRDRAVRVGGDLGPDHEAVVAEICRELDGLPLAIELAAARTAALSPSRLLDVLRREGARSLGSRRGRPDRHRDLWAVADWSYQLLHEDERVLFERLGIFAGTFTPGAAHAVCAPEGWTESMTTLRLAMLVESSLVSRADHGLAGAAERYRLLRPLRELARQRSADRGDLPDLVRRYADHVIAEVERAAGPPLRSSGQRRILRALDDVREVGRWSREADDLEALGRLIAALFRFEYLRRGVEFLGWAVDVVGRDHAKGSPYAPQLHAAAAVAAWRGGDLEQAEEVARIGTELGRGCDDPARRLAFEARGDVAAFEGRLGDAAAHFAEAARLAGIGDDGDTEALGLASLALVLAYGGDIDAARVRVEEAAAVEGAGEGVRAFVRYARGECLADEEPERAIVLVEEAAELARSAEAWFVDGVARLTAASLRARHGDPYEALPVFADLVDHWRRSGSWPQQWTTLRNLAELLVRVGAEESAVAVASAVRVQQSDSSVFGTESVRLDRAMATARRRLGSDRFEAAQEGGEAMTRQQLVDRALTTIARVRASIADRSLRS